MLRANVLNSLMGMSCWNMQPMMLYAVTGWDFGIGLTY